MPNRDYGNDEINRPRVAMEFVLLIVALAVMVFLTINTVLFETSQIYLWTGTLALAGITAAFVMNKMGKQDIFDVMIAEKPMLNINRKLLYIIFLAVFIFSFFIVSNTDYRVAVPQFQTVDLGLQGVFWLTIGAAFIEDVFFFVLIPGVLFSVSFWLFKSKGQSSGGIAFWTGIASVGIGTPIIFALYHLAVYGFANQAAMFFVFFFALENIIMLILFRDITYAHARHIGNNAGILIFSQMSLATFITVVLTNPIVWVVIALIFIGGYIKYKRSGV